MHSAGLTEERDHRTLVKGQMYGFDVQETSHLKDKCNNLEVLDDIVGSVQEEAGDHAIKALRLAGSAVHLHKVARAHAHAPSALNAGPGQHIRDVRLRCSNAEQRKAVRCHTLYEGLPFMAATSCTHTEHGWVTCAATQLDMCSKLMGRGA